MVGRPVGGKRVVFTILSLIALGAGGLIWKAAPRRAGSLAPTLNLPTGRMVLIEAGRFVHGPDQQVAIVPAFYMDTHPVTMNAYKDFCDATKRSLPKDFDGNMPGRPVVNIRYGDAEAFAKWAGKRLPDALEWEKALPGITTEGAVFELVRNTATPSQSDTDDFTSRVSPPPTPGETWYTIKGGSFLQSSVQTFPHMWKAVPARYSAADIGFRCAKDP